MNTRGSSSSRPAGVPEPTPSSRSGGPATKVAPDAAPLGRLLEVGRHLTKELDPEVVLDKVLEAAKEMTGARYAALGILNDRHTELERFLTSGIDAETERAIGSPPRGRGVLGTLIAEPTPMRLTNIGAHPRSYGFPLAHPLMRTFLGVPVLIDEVAWGNLYLTDKADGDFTEADEEGVVILAEWASIAIKNARLYATSEKRREELEEAFARIEATREVSTAISLDLELEHVLDLIAKRGRALIGARSLVIMLRDADDLVVEAAAGHVDRARGMRLPIEGSTSGQALERGRSERIDDVSARLRVAPVEFGVLDPRTALLVPMTYRGEAVGILAAFDRGDAALPFTEEDEQMLISFAASAATAVTLARSVKAGRLHSSLVAADAERRRWARELHDETLQGLAALKLTLAAARGDGGARSVEGAMDEAVSQIDHEIENLRAIISDLRPAALDQLGLQGAIEVLLDHHGERSGIKVEREFALDAAVDAKGRLAPDLEGGAYRLVQEAMTNVARHASADGVKVSLSTGLGALRIVIEDDGDGFDPLIRQDGFGLVGMKERVDLAGGTLDISSSSDGTVVTASLPLLAAPDATRSAA